ncbi:ABC transporter outer membrane protein [Alcanivorax hongdengensis A-11-3]|uniref:ABC transporter outer membrane protein n=2 Tax=Alcanivorax hongdengensis TaxID=519051 RepID=L0WDC8_9GAMM|nr:ABC transporter outer membrane protein [Alcanivorax hongdengensis A-11-3]
MLVLGGCAVRSGLETPQPSLPAQWLNQESASAAMVAQPQWWRQFHSDTLDGLVRKALNANTDLLAATARVDQAQAQLQQAGASLFPSLGLSGSGSRSGVVGEGGSNSYAINANASYEVDLWGKLRGSRDAAEATLQASAFSRDTVQLTVVASVVNTYLQVCYLTDNLALARDNLALAEKVLAVVQAKAQYGAVSRQDLAQQKTVVANQRARLPALRQQLLESRYALAVLVGEMPQQFNLTAESLADLALPTVQAGLPDQVLARRPDVAAALATLMAADARVAVARADYWPSITLTGSAGYGSSALSELLSGDALYSLGLSLGETLFDGGARRARTDQARAAWREQVASYTGTLLTALQEVDQSLAAIQSLSAQTGYRQEALSEAEKAFTVAQVRYREGETEITDMLSVQSQLNSARQNSLDLVLSQYQARVTLYRVLGQGSEPGSLAADS